MNQFGSPRPHSAEEKNAQKLSQKVLLKNWKSGEGKKNTNAHIVLLERAYCIFNSEVQPAPPVIGS